MSETEGQNKDHAAALKIAVCNGWTYLSAATSFHYLKRHYDVMYKVRIILFSILILLYDWHSAPVLM